ncbi:MAG: hypothetical protein R3324_14705, partial [Halobacteriales archaeon]|nr:hypothetical protein [Halobacteriales archaeon]
MVDSESLVSGYLRGRVSEVLRMDLVDLSTRTLRVDLPSLNEIGCSGEGTQIDNKSVTIIKLSEIVSFDST